MDDALAREAKERWGDTEAYRMAAARTAGYSGEQWDEAKAEADEIGRQFVAAMEQGADGIGVAERHRRHIEHWYYPCSPQMHLQLGEMYVADTRFKQYWENYAPGLAEFVRDAIRANSFLSLSGRPGLDSAES